MSWPTRCGTLMLASTRSAQAAVAVGVGGCVGVALALGAVVCDDDKVGVGVAACGEQAPAISTTATANAVRRRKCVNTDRFEDTGHDHEHRDDDLRAPHRGHGPQSEHAAR